MPIYISDNDYFRWQYNGNEYVLHIQQDSDPENPRTLYDHDCLMACFHPRYRLGDTIYQREPEAFWQGLVRKYVPEATLFNKANAKPDEIPDRYTWEDNDGTVYGNLTSWKVCLYYVEDLTIPQCQSLLYPYLVSLPLRPDHSPMPKPALPLLSLPAPVVIRPWGYHHRLRRPCLPLR